MRLAATLTLLASVGCGPVAGSSEVGGRLTPTHFPFAAMEELAAGRAGACTTCAVRLEVRGGLDVSSLDKALHLVRASTGESSPWRAEWNAAERILSVRPAHGHALAHGEEHLVIVTHDALGSDGLPLERAAGLDGELSARRALLDALGMKPREVVALLPFVTDAPAADLEAVKSSLEASPSPVATAERLWTGADLDALLGVPESDAPGFERPASDGGSAVRHATTGWVVNGTFDAPRFVEGSGTGLGPARRDASGRPVPASTDAVPFVLIVPADADLDALPVVIAHHGFSSSREVGFVLADTAGRAGWAVLAIDAYQHGARAPSARDTENRFRGLAEPDGFPETDKLDVTGRVFGLFGVPSDDTLSPDYPLGAFLQFAADALSAIRLVREGDLASVRALDPALAGLTFDPERVVFFGNSMGAVVGSAVRAARPPLAGMVLNVMPGSIIETLADSPEFRPLVDRLFLPILDIEPDFDEVERSLLFDPTVDLFRWMLEPVDPLALSRVESDLEVLVQLAGHDEVAVPRASESVVASAGFERVTRYPDAMHGMLEVALQDSHFEPPLHPPHSERLSPLAVGNPIESVHAELESFLRER